MKTKQRNQQTPAVYKLHKTTTSIN